MQTKTLVTTVIVSLSVILAFPGICSITYGIFAFNKMNLLKWNSSDYDNVTAMIGFKFPEIALYPISAGLSLTVMTLFGIAFSCFPNIYICAAFASLATVCSVPNSTFGAYLIYKSLLMNSRRTGPQNQTLYFIVGIVVFETIAFATGIFAVVFNKLYRTGSAK
ncbi:hypothetical protein ACOME3_000350 [Neoechinorhynchus agilis]